MKKIVVFQHVAYEILGTLHPIIKNAGIRIRYVNFDRHPNAEVRISDYDGVVILGGPMGVADQDKYPHLKREIQYIQEAQASGKPMLGICLGAQLIAAALGASVNRADKREIGWHDVHLTGDGEKDPLLGVLKKTEKIFQWHEDTLSLPKGSTWLAHSEACPHQAFRHGEKTYGFQFHLEVDAPMINRWLSLPEHQALVEKNHQAMIRIETTKYMEQNLQLSQKVFLRYLELFSSKKKKIVLGSGPKGRGTF